MIIKRAKQNYFSKFAVVLCKHKMKEKQMEYLSAAQNIFSLIRKSLHNKNFQKDFSSIIYSLDHNNYIKCK